MQNRLGLVRVSTTAMDHHHPPQPCSHLSILVLVSPAVTMSTSSQAGMPRVSIALALSSLGWRRPLWLPRDDLCARETQVRLLAPLHPLRGSLCVCPSAAALVPCCRQQQRASKAAVPAKARAGRALNGLHSRGPRVAAHHSAAGSCSGAGAHALDFCLGACRRLRVARQPGGSLLPAPAGRGAAVCGLHGGAAHAGAAAGAHRPAGAAAAGVLRSHARLPGCGARAPAALARAEHGGGRVSL